jgi:hypothetical protein
MPNVCAIHLPIYAQSSSRLARIELIILQKNIRQPHGICVARYSCQSNEMLAAASFSGSCPIQRNGSTFMSCEMLRYASKMGCVVAGGMGKLIAHFIRKKHPEDVMTYIDADWGNGSGLYQLGFKRIEYRNPQKFWLNANYERCYNANDSSAITCWNSGSWKFVKICK